MPLLSKVKDIFKSSSSAKKKKVYHNVKLDNPEEFWDVIGELGDGAYGKVYKAQHKDTGQLAALKQVNLEEEDDLENFMVEIDILCECKHPNIVELLEAYHYDGKLWMYLEYCDGGAVDSIMVDLDRPLTEPQIAFLCQGLCNALVYVHSNKVIHRDLKAGNVLLTMEGGVKLADFGVSAKNKNTFDKRGTFIGTPYWLAPEVILCETFIDAKYDYKADIWSLGISLIEFAQMDPPNHEVSPVRVMLKIQKSDPPRLDFPSRWSKDFNDFIAKCLTKDPALRPNAEELLKHPFLNKNLDKKPIIDLLLEYKAEVVEEDVDDDSEKGKRKKKPVYKRIDSPSECTPKSLASLPEDQDPCRLSTVSEPFTNSSKFDSESLNSIEKDSTLHTNDENEKLPSAVLEDREVNSGISSEKRISKGPAPLPPVVSTNNQPSPKKGPAPAVPSVSPVTTATPVTICTTTSSVIAVTSITSVSPPAALNTSSVSSTNTITSPSLPPSGKDDLSTSPEPDKSSKSTPSINDNNINSTRSPVESPVVSPIMSIPDSRTSEPDILCQKLDDEDGGLSVIDSIPVGKSVYVYDSERLEQREKVTINSSDILNDRKDQEVEFVSASETAIAVPGSSIVGEAMESTPSEPVTFSVVSSSSPSNNSVAEAIVQTSDLLLASISSEGTVIVRSPTPTSISSETASKVSNKNDSIVTYTVAGESEASAMDISPEVTVPVTSSVSVLPVSEGSAAISVVPEGSHEVSVNQESSSISVVPESSSTVSVLQEIPVSVVPDSPTLTVVSESSTTTEVKLPTEIKSVDTVASSVSTESAIGEAEAHAVFILESAIDSALESSSAREEAKGEVVVVTPEGSDPDVSILDVSGHKLDESEVLITSSSIPEEEEKLKTEPRPDDSTIVDQSKSAEASVSTRDEEVSPHHVSVVSVDENKGESDSVKVIDDVSLSTSEPGQVSLTIEGTTLEDTDVDEVESASITTVSTVDVKDVQKNVSSNKAETVICLENEKEKTLTTVTTPSTTPSTPTAGDSKPKNLDDNHEETTPLQPIQNGIRRQNSRASDERSDTDTTSTIGSDKENRHLREENDVGNEEVTLRHANRKANTASTISSETMAKNLKNKELQASIALRKKTRKRTRKFVIDGVVVTTTTSKVIYGDDEDTGMFSSAHLARKQELRELKLVQKREQKQFQDLALKANIARQEQEKKFELEKVNLLRSYDSQIENLIRQQKQLVEKAEARQESELKIESKKTRVDQERELKAFRESLKQEWKLLKQEVDLLPKDRRKENFKIRKEQLERDQAEREKACLERLNDSHEMALKRLNDKHRKHIALKERQFLEEKHQLLRARESALWDMEERHIQDKHQLAKEQLKDIYFLQRLQMTIRHNVELEQVRRFNQQKEEALLKRQHEEKRQLPKRIRQEMKTREKMFREQMRISMTQLPSHEHEKDQIKKFQEQEKIKYDKERKRAELKHKKQMEELTATTEASVKELVHLQNEKGKLLTEHETYKLKSLDEEYQKELREWKSNLAPRKHKLEEDFERQLKEQEKFYGDYLEKGLGFCTPSQSTTSLASSHH